jgi:glutathione S-transferase
MVQKQIRRDLHGQGIGRHTDAEINAMAVDDLRALSEHLGDNQYFMGATPTSYDATAYGFLTNILRAPFELPVQAEIDKLPNLAAYCERLDKQGLLNA